MAVVLKLTREDFFRSKPPDPGHRPTAWVQVSENWISNGEDWKWPKKDVYQWHLLCDPIWAINPNGPFGGPLSWQRVEDADLLRVPVRMPRGYTWMRPVGKPPRGLVLPVKRQKGLRLKLKRKRRQ